MGWETATVVRAAAGDRRAFDDLAERCRPWVYGLCFRLVGDRVTAEDLAQEALLQAYRSLEQLRDPSRFRPWLSRIAVNLCRMHLRQQAGRPEVLPTSDMAASSETEQGETPLPLREALTNVDATARRLLSLVYVEGLSHQELAEVLSLSASAVKSRLHRARERLRKEMLKMMTDEQRERLGLRGESAPARAVLLVEPDEAVRERVRRALEKAGYQVTVAPDGEAALEAVQARSARLLILDKRCGTPHWTEVLLLLQVDVWAKENVQYGVLIDKGNQRDILLAWQGGAAFCLTHPFDASEVVDLVNRLSEACPETAPHD
jgi:RNA polymerase sigma-70 factor (ECF subfamily)